MSLPIPNPDNANLRFANYELLFANAGPGGHGGVGFILAPRIFAAIMDMGNIGERVAWVRIRGAPINITIIATYAPHNGHNAVEKDNFYSALSDAVERVPKGDIVLIGGDFNGQIGPQTAGESKHVGRYGVGTRCDNGERLVSFAFAHDLFVASTNFRQRTIRHSHSWVAPGGRFRSQIDHWLVPSRWRGSVLSCRSYWGTSHCSDHALVRMDVRLRLRSVKKDTAISFDLDSLRIPEKAEAFRSEVAARFDSLPQGQSVDEQWRNLKCSLVDSAASVLGRRKRKRDRHWMQADTLRAANSQSEIPASDVAGRRRARARLRALCSRDLNQHWTDIADNVNANFLRGNTNCLFNFLRKRKSNKGRLSDRVLDVNGEPVSWGNRLGRWREHFDSLLNSQPPLNPLLPDEEPAGVGAAAANISPPTAVEIDGAIRGLKCGKAAGPDALPGELFKACRADLIPALMHLFGLIWEHETIPVEWFTAILVPVFKKGNKMDCSNYRGISLLCVCMKILEWIILKRMSGLYENILRENQAGFRPGRGCIDQIFSLRAMLELRYEFRRPTIITFVDFKAAFDSVDRDGLWNILYWDGVPLKLRNILKAMYLQTQSTVRAYGQLSEPFIIRSGVRQGALLSPGLFSGSINWVMKRAMEGLRGVLCVNGNGDITDFDYADDIALVAEDPAVMQEMLNRIVSFGARVGLTINAAKTKVLASCCPAPILTVGGTQLDCVESFRYLGSEITSNCDPRAEISIRIGRAREAFESLREDVFNNRRLHKDVKLLVFDSVVRNTLLYGCETWPMRVNDSNRLCAFQMECYRKILRVTYRDHVSNLEVLRRLGRSDEPRLSTVVKERRLRWLGHVLRMPEGRFPKQTLLFNPPRDWKRPRGGVRTTWVRTAEKDALPLRDIYSLGRRQWESGWLQLMERLALDRPQYKEIVRLLTGAT